MNNIYDVLLNFDKERVNYFYEWNDSDVIEHIKKMPLYRISDKQMNLIVNNTIKVNNNFLMKIFNKTEKYVKNRVNVIPYAVIFGNEKDAYAFKFNKLGEEISRSDFLFDEKEEVLAILEKMKVDCIDIDCINKLNFNYETRFELNNKSKLRKELKRISEYDSFDKLKYIYYEVFGVMCDDKKRMLVDLNNEIDNNFDVIYYNLIELLKMFNIKR